MGDAFKAAVDFLNHYVWSFPESLPWLVVALLGTGFFVTARLGLIQVRRLGHALAVVAGRYDDPEDEGDISHFQALSTALSATVGIGNIAGVATAIHYGGPGAMFWMWLTAGLGMAVKYCECTLAVRYRDFDSSGLVAGGPMYYIEKGLGPNFKWMAMLFAACGALASFGSGNMNQANTVRVSAVTDFGATPLYVGFVTAGLVGAVILGGIRRIAGVSSTLAPSMAAVYVAGALAILAFRADEIPAAFATIVSDALSPRASMGGSVLGVFSVTLLWGVKRGLFSNEAGQGSAPIAHAAAKTDEPVREGVVAMLEPLIDTLIICTMTGLVIITTGVWDEKHETTVPMSSVTVHAEAAVPSSAKTEAERIMAIENSEVLLPAQVQVRAGKPEGIVFVASDGLVEDVMLLQGDNRYTGSMRFENGNLVEPDGLLVQGRMLLNSSALTAAGFKRGLSPLGSWGNYVVTFCVFMFALSTMISWSYYGDRCVNYLFGSALVLPYRVLFTCFTFLGCMLALETVWAYGDLMLGIMVVPNLIAIVLLSPELVRLTNDYFRKVLGGDA